MSKAKDEYNNIVRQYEENSDIIICDIYIEELEQQKAELIATLNQLSDLSTKDGWIDRIILPVLKKYSGE